MNERIRELAEQAIANVRFWKGCNQESYGVDEQELAKFAELIVRECMNLTEGCRDKYLNSAPYKIAEHFGVEFISKPEPPLGRVLKEWTIPK